MGESISLQIESVGRYLPERVVTAAEVAEMLGVEESWIIEKAGVAERRWVDGETPLEMSVAATRDALTRADLIPEDIDLIIYASATFHQIIPDTAALLQRELGLGRSGIKSFSVHSTCLSFLTALDIASSHLAMGKHRKVLVASAEIASAGLDKSEPESAALLGDMATAVIIGIPPEGSDSALHSLVLRTFGDGADLCRLEAGYAKHPLKVQTTPQDYMFHMDGPAVFRMAYELFPPIIAEALQEAGVGLADIDLVVPHQASLLAVRVMQRALGIRDDQIILNLDRFGNCVAASLPGALYDAIEDQMVARGDTVLLAGTGAGLSMAAAVLTW
jgi:3-oxoacyl-[acyl-carrier-protein] synthase III